MTRHPDLKSAQRAADVAEAHIRMTREYLEHRVRQLEQERERAEYRLEEAQTALSMFNAKGDMAPKVAP